MRVGPHGRMRELAPRLLALSLGVGLPLIAAEGTLRLLPVSTGLGALPVNATDPVLRFVADSEFTYSNGWRLQMVNRGHINNAGFVSDLNYQTGTSAPPLAAVIGDSYVEAAMVPWADTIAGRLGAALEGRARVYGFGASGAPLSQYLVWARHARDQFGAERYVFVVVGNDFDESLVSVSDGGGFHYFDDLSGADPWPLVRIDYAPGPLRRLARASTLTRYLIHQLHVEKTPGQLARLLGVAATGPRWVGNTAASVAPERLERSARAIERFLELLPEATGVAPDQVLLVLDGIRPQLYGDGLSGAGESYFGVMRRELLQRAGTHGYPTIDLQPRFIEEHRASGQRFEFEIDGHWNGDGHAVATRAVLESGLFSSS